MEPHPVRLVVADDLRRSRLTVFFRLLLAIPHLLWLGLFGSAAVLMAVVNWAATLIRGTPPEALHEFLSMFVRYTTHVTAYLALAANPYPGFTGTTAYPVDVEIDPPARQNRWTVGFRVFLAIPALLLVAAFLGHGGSAGRGYGVVAGVLGTVAFLAWFYALVTGRMPRGMRDLQAYALRYTAQADAYLLVLTDRYPDAAPDEPAEPRRPHPIALTVADDLRRSRLTTFFRLLLAVPHVVWLLLWSVAAFVAAFANWVVTLVRAVPARPLHRFLAAYVRYSTHVTAFVALVANPFPGFTGTPGYPVDLVTPDPERQSRWTVGFRWFLAFPASVVLSAVQGVLLVAALLGWFHALVLGRTAPGLRDAGAYATRYQGQVYGYLFLLTGRYPDSGPPA